MILPSGSGGADRGQLLPHRAAGDGERVPVQGTPASSSARSTTGDTADPVDVGHHVPPERLDVGQVRGAVADPVEVLAGVSSTLASVAIASRCSTALVDPPTAITTAIAFLKAWLGEDLAGGDARRRSWATSLRCAPPTRPGAGRPPAARGRPDQRHAQRLEQSAAAPGWPWSLPSLRQLHLLGFPSGQRRERSRGRVSIGVATTSEPGQSLLDRRRQHPDPVARGRLPIRGPGRSNHSVIMGTRSRYSWSTLIWSWGVQTQSFLPAPSAIGVVRGEGPPFIGASRRSTHGPHADRDHEHLDARLAPFFSPCARAGTPAPARRFSAGAAVDPVGCCWPGSSFGVVDRSIARRGDIESAPVISAPAVRWAAGEGTLAVAPAGRGVEPLLAHPGVGRSIDRSTSMLLVLQVGSRRMRSGRPPDLTACRKSQSFMGLLPTHAASRGIGWFRGTWPQGRVPVQVGPRSLGKSSPARSADWTRSNPAIPRHPSTCGRRSSRARTRLDPI